MIYVGKNKIKRIYVGEEKIKKVYIGDTRIYSAGNIVTYHVDTNVTHTEEVDADETVLSPKTFIPSKDGWEFTGWRQDTIASADVLSDLVMDDEPINLYAVFQQSVTLSYNGNGNNSGSVKAETKQRYYNNSAIINPSFTVKSNSFLKTNYTFVTWRLNNATSGTAYAPNTTITLAANAIMYAEWITNTLTVFTKSGCFNNPTVYNTSYVILDGAFSAHDSYNYGGAIAGRGFASFSGDYYSSGTATIKPGNYKKATITLKCYSDNGAIGSSSVSGSFGNASRSYFSDSDFTASASGSTLVLNINSTVKVESGTSGYFGMYISSIVLSV